MSVQFVKPQSVAVASAPVAPTRKRGPAQRPPVDLTVPARLYISDLMAVLRVSRKTIYNRVAAGAYPAPDGHDLKRPYWFSATIRPLVSGGAA
jgi:hypothetical protein